jgi:hypothetical protein
MKVDGGRNHDNIRQRRTADHDGGRSRVKSHTTQPDTHHQGPNQRSISIIVVLMMIPTRGLGGRLAVGGV